MMDQSGASWMDAGQQEQFREICGLIDTIKSGRDFYRVMERINGGGYSVDVINAAREYKKCFNSAQYEPQDGPQDAARTVDGQQEEAGTAAEAASKGQEAALGTPDTMAGTDATAADAGQDNPQNGQKGADSAVTMDDQGVTHCGECGAEILCNECGDMPDFCPKCGKKLDYTIFTEAPEAETQKGGP